MSAGRWFASGRVPRAGGRGYETKQGGPFTTSVEAWRWAKDRRLGGIKVWTEAGKSFAAS